MTTVGALQRSVPLPQEASWYGPIHRRVVHRIESLVEMDGVINVLHKGAKGDGTTDDSTAIQAAVDALETVGDNSILVFPGDRTYLLDTTVSFTVPNYAAVLAWGAHFKSTKDQVMFDLNDGANFSQHAATLRKDVHWIGGRFENSAGTQTSSVALQAHLFRVFSVSLASFEGWHYAIEFAGLDSYTFDRLFFHDNDVDIIHPAGLVADIDSIPLIVNETNCHHSHPDSDQWCFKMLHRFQNLHFRGSSFNGKCGKIYVNFDEAVFSNTLSIQDCHFEQNNGTNPDIHVDQGSETDVLYNVSIHGCQFQSGNSGWKGVFLERCEGVDIDNTDFWDGSGAGTEVAIDLDNNCAQVRIGQNVTFQNIATPLNLGGSFDRDELIIEPEIRRIAPTQPASFDGDSFSTGNTTIDMSSELSSVWPAYGVPKGYFLHVQARDSGSAGAACRVSIKRISSDNNILAMVLNLQNGANDALYGASGFTACDANGDINVDYVATGADTLDIWITILGMVM
jgi:hypothetical protein